MSKTNYVSLATSLAWAVVMAQGPVVAYAAVCGNGECETDENACTCPADCVVDVCGACCPGAGAVCSEADFNTSFGSARFVGYDPDFGCIGQAITSSNVTVSFWNLRFGALRGTLDLPSDTKGIAVDPGRRRAFISTRIQGETTRSVVIVNLETMALTANVPLTGNVSAARGMAVVPSTGKVVIPVAGGPDSTDGLMLLDPETGTVVGALQNIHHPGSFSEPIEVVILEENGLSVVVVANGDELVAPSLTLVPLAEIAFSPDVEPAGGPLPAMPRVNINGAGRAIVGDPPNNRTMVGWNNAGNLARVDIVTIASNTTGSLTSSIQLDPGAMIDMGLELNPSRNELYAALGSGGTAVVDLETETPVEYLQALKTSSLSIAAVPLRESVLIVGIGQYLSERCPAFCMDGATETDCNAIGGLFGGAGSDCGMFDPPCVPPRCGDGNCDAGENSSRCPADCEGSQAPQLVAEGCRYLAFTPTSGTQAVAVLVTSFEWPCLSKYADANGLLGATPVYQLPEVWGTVHLHGSDIIPSTPYGVQVVIEGEVVCGSTEQTTWMWGDADNDGAATFGDILFVVHGFQGDFSGASPQATDLEPCEPNDVVNFADILMAVLAFQGNSYGASTGCLPPCP